MLQQTQVPRVAVKYREFLALFPTVRALATATPGQVVRAWQGMGYNRRALWLHQAARQVVADHSARIPDSYDDLLSLPGVGPNTARGILSFAFDRHEAVHDVNVERVLGRLFPSRSKRRGLHAFATSILPNRQSYQWNQALMDLGATVCTARVPACSECPLHRRCPSAGVAKSTRMKAKRPEPSYRGIPRRLYRGRLVRILTGVSHLNLRGLTQRLFGSASSADIAWVKQLLTTLLAEGLVRVSSRNKRRIVSLVR